MEFGSIKKRTLQETVAGSCRVLRRNSWQLKVETELDGFRARRNEMRSAERGQEIVHRGFVRQVDDRETQTPFVSVAVKEIILANAHIEQVAGFDARWVAVQVKRGARNIDQLCACPQRIRAANGPGTQGERRGQ